MTHEELTHQLDTTWNWLIEQFSAMSNDELAAATTPSEYDSAIMWSAQDHFVHLFGIEQRFKRAHPTFY